MALRWGIASAGKISHDFVSAIATLPSEDHQVIAVAARELTRAQEFATLHKIKNAYQGYEPLAQSPDVDIVYIGSLNPQHYEMAKLMLENGKHVLCEKPLCMNYKQAKSLIDFARQKKLFLMEAIWSRFFPAYYSLRESIKSGELGEIHQVNAEFGVPISNVERLNTKKLGGGTILDIGVYVLQFAQTIFGCEPTKIVAAGHKNADGVDESMSCVMTYSNGGTATLTTHSKVNLSNEAVVVGSKGSVKLSYFWCPVNLKFDHDCNKEFPLPIAPQTFNFTNSVGLRYEAEECRQCIKKGLTESAIMSLDESLVLAKLEDTIRKQIGVHYDEDN